MGWNFGCTIIEFDFQGVIEELLEPERRQFLTGGETPEEARSKTLIDAGTVVIEALGITGIPDDAPITFSDATSRDFDGYGVSVAEGKTILVGRRFGLDQDSPELSDAYARISDQRGAVFAFWFNDASDTYMFSAFRAGARIRFWTSGSGLADAEGERLPYEPEIVSSGHQHLMVLLTAVAGRQLADLLELTMERFSAY